jgi:serine-threonine kinase receptor-associated protein
MVAYPNGYGSSANASAALQNSNGNVHGGSATPTVKVQPLLCSGHTRPVVHLQFSNM